MCIRDSVNTILVFALTAAFAVKTSVPVFFVHVAVPALLLAVNLAESAPPKVKSPSAVADPVKPATVIVSPDAIAASTFNVTVIVRVVVPLSAIVFVVAVAPLYNILLPVSAVEARLPAANTVAIVGDTDAWLVPGSAKENVNTIKNSALLLLMAQTG